MPIKIVALKQLRKSRIRAQRNQAVHSELKTLKKNLLALIAQQNVQEAQKLMPVLMRRFSQAGAKGLIHHKTASRVISRLSKRLHAPVHLPAPPQNVGGAQAGTSSPPPAQAPS